MTTFTLSRRTALTLPDGIGAPRYDICAVRPGIVHIGIGGFHRSHMARYTHDLMGAEFGALRWGIVGAGLRESDGPLLNALNDQDGLYTLVERDAHGDRKCVIGSVVGAIDASVSTQHLLEAIAQSEICIVSITVSEAGYLLDTTTKRLDLATPAVRHDIANPNTPKTMPGVLVAAFRHRRDNGLPPFTALSCDNIQHNGRVLRGAVRMLAAQTDESLAAWIAGNARFPNSMVDRITPIPTRGEIGAFAEKTGLADNAPVFCERFRQWVIEDDFANGRPDWSRVGAQFVSDVAPYEAMKLRLLNTSHLAIAGLGALAGCVTVEETMGDRRIRRYMQRLMDEETGLLLAPVPGIDLEQYKATLIERFANPAIRDTVKRINTDAPLNLLLDPLRDALAKDARSELLALGLAAWCLRVCGEAGAGETMIGANAGDELQRHAAACSDDPAKLLSITSKFGDLGRNEALVNSVNSWLGTIKQHGIDAALDRI
jgi:mannitol-1-phosphate/altronate dehydrogenase